MTFNLEGDEALSAAIAGLPKIAELIAAVPAEDRARALEAAEKSYVPCAGFRTPGMKRHSHALAAGVRKAPRHEIAVGSAPAVRRALNEIERCMVRGRVIF
jgi:hypothetical protein